MQDLKSWKLEGNIKDNVLDISFGIELLDLTPNPKITTGKINK